MVYELIFYISKKTGLCEKQLQKILLPYSFKQNFVSFASSPIELGDTLTKALNRCYIIFVIGGLQINDSQNFANVMSRVIGNTSTQNIETKKLKSINNNDGYLITKGKQIIIALPDEPQEIKQMLNPALIDYIKKVTDN